MAAAVLSTVTTLSAMATTVAPPNDEGELTRRAELVVLAKALASQVVGTPPALYTETRFETIEPFKGPSERTFSVVVPGGEKDGAGWLASGSPRFAEGQTYLLFLHRARSGEWQPVVSSYGLLKEEKAADGTTTLLAPLPEVGALNVAHGDFEHLRTYDKSRLVPHLHAVVEGREKWNSAAVVAGEDKRSKAALAAAPPGCALSTANGVPVRWTAFDKLTTIPIYADTTGDKSLPGGGFAEVEGAASDWSSINGSSIRMKYEGKKSVSLGCTGNGIDVPPMGTNIVIFNDPCSDIPDLSECGGTFAVGGPFYQNAEHSFAGEKWKSVTGWFVIVNNGVGCVGSDSYRLLMTHEMGHGLGFAHTDNPTSLMNARCCNKINDLDVSCARYVYPGELKPTPPPKETLVVSVVVDATTAKTRYSSELTITNESASTVTTTLRFTPGSGGAEAVGSTHLGPGSQLILPEILNWLRQQGARIAAGTQAGTLRVEIDGATKPGLVHVSARTTAATSGTQPTGAAGLSYTAYPATAYDQTSATVFGLRTNVSDRSNLAVFNPASVPVTVKVTAFSGDGSGRTAVISAATSLPAFGWTQFNGVLDGVQMTNGWVTVERTSATGQFGTYGVINDNATNDGSYVESTRAPASGNNITVPILVETDAFQSELILANRGPRAAEIALWYIESARESMGEKTQGKMTLAAGTQLIIPEAIQFLREKGLVGPRSEGAHVGALRMTVTGVPLSAVFAGARTSSPSPAGGKYGLFTPCLYEGEEAATDAEVLGLRSDETNRSNVAVINAAPGWGSSVTLEVRTFDGDAGGIEKGEPQTVTLLPGQLKQFNNILATRNIRSGWVRITRTAGSAAWLAYGIVNDGARPGERTGDGAYISMVRNQRSSAAAVSRSTSNSAKGSTERVHDPLKDVFDKLKLSRPVSMAILILLLAALVLFFKTRR